MKSRLRGIFLLLIATAIALPGVSAAQDDFDGNTSCPSMSQFYVYVSGVPYGTKINGKVNLYGKPCVSIEAKDVAAEGKCVAPSVCKADLCDGKPCKTPSAGTQGSQTGTEEPKFPSFNPGEVKDLQGGILNPDGTSKQTEDLSKRLLDPTPISQSAQNFQDQIQSAAQKPGILDSIKDWFFSPEPVAQQSAPLEGGTVPDIDASSVQTLKPDSTTVPEQSFTSGGLTQQELIEQANTFAPQQPQQGAPSECVGWYCMIVNPFRPENAQFTGPEQPTLTKEAIGNPFEARTTFYGPGAGGSVQGGFETSRAGLDGEYVPRTLDDVRLGKANAVTLATAPENYGRYYDLGAVTYKSPLDGQTYTGDKEIAAQTGAIYDPKLENVTGYSHDTGSAFRAGTCANWGTCGERLNKYDVAVGDFRGWSGKATYDFLTSTGQEYGGNRLNEFQRLAGVPTQSSPWPSPGSGNSVQVASLTSGFATSWNPWESGTAPVPYTSNPIPYTSEYYDVALSSGLPRSIGEQFDTAVPLPRANPLRLAEATYAPPTDWYAVAQGWEGGAAISAQQNLESAAWNSYATGWENNLALSTAQGEQARTEWWNQISAGWEGSAALSATQNQAAENAWWNNLSAAWEGNTAISSTQNQQAAENDRWNDISAAWEGSVAISAQQNADAAAEEQRLAALNAEYGRGWEGLAAESARQNAELEATNISAEYPSNDALRPEVANPNACTGWVTCSYQKVANWFSSTNLTGTEPSTMAGLAPERAERDTSLDNLAIEYPSGDAIRPDVANPIDPKNPELAIEYPTAGTGDMLPEVDKKSPETAALEEKLLQDRIAQAKAENPEPPVDARPWWQKLLYPKAEVPTAPAVQSDNLAIEYPSGDAIRPDVASPIDPKNPELAIEYPTSDPITPSAEVREPMTIRVGEDTATLNPDGSVNVRVNTANGTAFEKLIPASEAQNRSFSSMVDTVRGEVAEIPKDQSRLPVGAQWRPFSPEPAVDWNAFASGWEGNAAISASQNQARENAWWKDVSAGWEGSVAISAGQNADLENQRIAASFSEEASQVPPPEVEQKYSWYDPRGWFNGTGLTGTESSTMAGLAPERAERDTSLDNLAIEYPSGDAIRPDVANPIDPKNPELAIEYPSNDTLRPQVENPNACSGWLSCSYEKVTNWFSGSNLTGTEPSTMAGIAPDRTVPDASTGDLAIEYPSNDPLRKDVENYIDSQIPVPDLAQPSAKEITRDIRQSILDAEPSTWEKIKTGWNNMFAPAAPVESPGLSDGPAPVQQQQGPDIMAIEYPSNDTIRPDVLNPDQSAQPVPQAPTPEDTIVQPQTDTRSTWQKFSDWWSGKNTAAPAVEQPVVAPPISDGPAQPQQEQPAPEQKKDVPAVPVQPQPEPQKQEPAKQEPATQEPAKQEPAKQEPAKFTPVPKSLPKLTIDAVRKSLGLPVSGQQQTQPQSQPRTPESVRDTGSGLFSGGFGGLSSVLGNFFTGMMQSLARSQQNQQQTPATQPPTQPPTTTQPATSTPVTPAKPSVAIVANPSVVRSGEKATLTWASVRTESCVIKADKFAYTATTTPGGSTSTPALSETTVFSISCSGQTGTATGQVRVPVQ